MLETAPVPARRNGEIAGFLLSLTFAASTALRDVDLAGLFQRVDPLLVALTALALLARVPAGRAGA